MLPAVEKDGRITARQIVLFSILLVPVTLAPFFIGLAGIYYLVGASLLGIWFLWTSIETARAKTFEKSRKLLLVSVLYLPIIYALMVFNH